MIDNSQFYLVGWTSRCSTYISGFFFFVFLKKKKIKNFKKKKIVKSILCCVSFQQQSFHQPSIFIEFQLEKVPMVLFSSD